jgi:hypothetical protein
MLPADVERELLRLHQYRKLDYQVAGSIVQLNLPSGSCEYAEDGGMSDFEHRLKRASNQYSSWPIHVSASAPGDMPYALFRYGPDEVRAAEAGLLETRLTQRANASCGYRSPNAWTGDALATAARRSGFRQA